MAWITNVEINTASPLNCHHWDGPPRALIHSRQHSPRQQPHRQNKEPFKADTGDKQPPGALHYYVKLVTFSWQHSGKRQCLIICSTIHRFCKDTIYSPHVKLVNWNMYQTTHSVTTRDRLRPCVGDDNMRPGGFPLQGFWDQWFELGSEIQQTEEAPSTVILKPLVVHEDPPGGLWVGPTCPGLAYLGEQGALLSPWLLLRTFPKASD